MTSNLTDMCRKVLKIHVFLTQEKMSLMMDKIRDMAIKDTKSKVHSCIYLELLELYASCWKQSESSERYYSDTLAELMATF